MSCSSALALGQLLWGYKLGPSPGYHFWATGLPGGELPHPLQSKNVVASALAQPDESASENANESPISGGVSDGGGRR